MESDFIEVPGPGSTPVTVQFDRSTGTDADSSVDDGVILVNPRSCNFSNASCAFVPTSPSGTVRVFTVGVDGVAVAVLVTVEVVACSVWVTVVTVEVAAALVFVSLLSLLPDTAPMMIRSMNTAATPPTIHGHFFFWGFGGGVGYELCPVGVP